MPQTKQRDAQKETAEKMKKLKGELAAIGKNGGARSGLLMGVLHKTQEIFGYIPRPAMDLISETLDVPTAHLFGMATFYNFFSLKPKARYQIHLCKGTACYVAGGSRLLERLKEELKIGPGDVTENGMFGISITRCLGCCGLSPVMQVNDDIYVRMVPEKIPSIIEHYRSLENGAGTHETNVGGFRRPGGEK